MAAFSASGDGFGSNAVAGIEGRNEAFPACAIPFLCTRIRSRSERGKRAPHRGCEANGDARPRITKWLHDVARQTLKAIDFAPRRPPVAEIAGQPITGLPEGLQ